MNTYKKKFYKKLIIFLSILFVFALLFFLRMIPDIAEGYSRTISRGIQYITSTLFSWLPFSAFELFVVLLVFYILLWLIYLIRHLHRFSLRGSSRYFLNFGIVISLICLIYLSSAGMEYYRYPVPIPQYSEILEDTDKYYEIASYFQDDYNAISKNLKYDENGALIKPYSIKELNEIMLEEFKVFDNDDYFTKKTTTAKEMNFIGLIYRELGITGVAFAPTGEANVNPYISAGEYAFTLAHEIAHTKGMIREEDANLVAAYICLNSKNEYLRYSGYVYTISTLYYLVQCTNNETMLKDYQNGFSEEIKRDNTARYKYWQQHNMLRKIGNFINDVYLKINGNKGTSSYGDNVNIDKKDNKYVVSSYSRYQALYLSIYFTNNK